jgi:hypothetical protein
MCKTVGDLAMQTRVCVAEVDQAINAEDVSRPAEFLLAVGREILGKLGSGEASGAVSGHDQHNPVALGHRAGHGAGGQQCLIVGVGVDKDQGARAGAAEVV